MNFLVLETSLIDRPNLISDRFISYEDGWENHWGKLDEHPPISWHSFASGMSGRFVSAPLDNWTEHIKWADMILLTWTYNPQESLKILRFCKKQGKKVIIAFHENGGMINLLSKNLDWLIGVKSLYEETDYISHYPHKDVNFVFSDSYQHKRVKIYNSYPDEKWKYFEDGEGALVGIQIKDNEIEDRNFMGNISLAYHYSLNPGGVTFINSSSQSNENIKVKLENLFDSRSIINVVSKTKNWYEFLELIDKHKYVINNDWCHTQGQVTSDAMFMGKIVNDSYTEHSKCRKFDLVYSTLQKTIGEIYNGH